LTFLRHKPGGVDGIFGGNTRGALQRFQAVEGRPKTTRLTNADFDALVEKAFNGDLNDEDLSGLSERLGC
jgi:hypothetical protein